MKVDGDLAGIHGTGVAIHNLVKGFHHMRSLYGDLARRSSSASKGIADECLFAPTAVIRQATAEGNASGCPYSTGTVFVLGLEAARDKAGARDLVFLDDMWSRCPAEMWVPALFEAVWECVIRIEP